MDELPDDYQIYLFIGNSSYNMRTNENVIIPDLEISVRDLNKNDILERKFPKNTTGVVVTKISTQSPLMFLSVNDVIVELQKKKVLNSQQFSNLIKELVNKDEKTLYLDILNFK